MASSINTVYANLDATSIDVSGITPTVYTLDELKMWTDSADLPARLLLPVDDGNQSTEMEWLNFGHSEAFVTWQITDLMLWANVNENTGLKDVADKLLEYAQDYKTMLTTFTPAADQPLWISNHTSTIDSFEWPESSGQFYWGVMVTLEITECI